MFWDRWSSERLGIAFAALAALGFSCKAIFVKLAYMEAPVDAITLLSLRMVFSLPVFLWVGVSSLRNGPPLSLRDGISLLVLGFLGYYGSSILDFMGLQYISAGLERLILFTYPMLTLLIGVAFMGKTLERREIKSMILSYAGIALAFAHDIQIADDSRQVMLGAGFVFAAAVVYAIYQACSETAIKKMGVARFSSLAMLVSVAGTEFHFFAVQPLSILTTLPASVYFYGMGMAVFSTVMPVFMLSASIRWIGAGRTALIGALGPVLTLFLGWWFLGENISLAQIAGTSLVLSGVLLVSNINRKCSGANKFQVSTAIDSSKKSEVPERPPPAGVRKDS